MSNPLNKGGEVPEALLSPDIDSDGIDIGTVDDLQDWVESLLKDEKSERRMKVPSKSSRVSVSELAQKRSDLFKTGSKFAPVSRTEIVGIDNILDQVDEILDWVANYKDYSKYGARPEPGILFEGSPGTGKTYTSRYMATLANALFVDVRDFPYTGRTMLAQDVKDLFDHARKAYETTKKPIILFWDEFEAAAIERSRNIPVEQKAIVSQITAELDGINGKPVGVLLIGCTNYGDEIDAALRRPGRMGVHVEFNAPNRVGKAKLLRLYLSKIRTKGEIDVDTASYFFDDSDTAASVEEAVQEAWRFAVYRWIKEGRLRRGPTLTQGDLLEIFLKRLVGPPPAYADVTPETHYRIAIHETGHALAAILLGVGLRLVTVRPGKEHLGKTMTYLKDPRTSTLEELQNHLKVGVAGFVVEDITGIPRGADAAGDTKAITEIALDMVDNQGFGRKAGLFNPRALAKRFYSVTPSISTRVIDDSDLDIQDLINQAENQTRELLLNFGVEKIKKLADRLIEVQTMTGKDFDWEVRNLGRG